MAPTALHGALAASGSPFRTARAALGSAAAVLSFCALVSGPAGAEPVSPSPAEQADAAFQEGRDLFDAGHFEQACEKFELSMRLDPSPGTLLNLGNCHESRGELVLALATFERALADAKVATDPVKQPIWLEAAEQRITSLSGRVPEITVRGAEPGARMLLDGQPVERLDARLRVDPGHHVLVATAAGKRAFEREFDVMLGQKLEIVVPPLEPMAAQPVGPEPTGAATSAPLPPAAYEETGATRYGAWPWVLGGTGAALLGTSLLTGLTARSKANRLERECTGGSCTNPSLHAVKDSAEKLALVTDLAWISGALAVGASVTLFILDDGAGETGTAFQTGCFDAGCGVLAAGRF